ncbi:MAG: hypothetical protein U5M50_08535 [Sphingobium sp.]|nr:hypothetical protein [Sphingobium sp.]
MPKHPKIALFDELCSRCVHSAHPIHILLGGVWIEVKVVAEYSEDTEVAVCDLPSEQQISFHVSDLGAIRYHPD